MPPAKRISHSRPGESRTKADGRRSAKLSSNGPVKTPATARVKVSPDPAPPKTLSLHKTPAPRRASPAVIDLGVLNQHLGYFARRMQIWIFQDFIRRLSRIDISPAQFSVLVVIGSNEGLSQAELAGTLGIERARLVRMLHLLEKRGLTQRLPSSADGRRHALRLTRAGQATLRRAQALAAQHEDNLRPKLGAERYRLLLEAMREF
jgi:DNA-binding MarR family transcriptional regulator